MQVIILLLFLGAVCNALKADPPADCPECGLRPDEIVLRYGYPVESHAVTTKDGFTLHMIRIPYGVHNDSGIGSRPPVLIMHGLLDSSSDWVVNLPDQSLPFILADAGYDVWLGNNRGCKWSLPTCDTEACWDFSFDEYIMYDWPAMVDFVLARSHAATLTYVGHSQGTLQAFGGLAYDVEMQKKVNLFVALAPVAFVYNIDSLLVTATARLNVDQLIQKFGFKEFLPSTDFIHEVAKLCDHTILRSVCFDVFYQLKGKNPTEGHNLNMSRFELITWNFPAGTSVKNMAHWGQIVRVNRFGMYDYGSDGNMLKYGQASPPDYDLTKIKTPTATFVGGYDVLADPMDAEKLEAILSNNGALVLAHKEESYDHADFIVGIDAHERVYPIVLQLLEQYAKPVFAQ
eukprot:TRINITY_DN1617_c0_g1_i4.p1 TRINITY_DN1617_c0_g1~~TRINITY_DN1617_c0_g1_i4.p1  ORF type:complete len:402 (+),score=81.24 TRINITY_DN1617_c0_g1_i4:1184-2389(+)